MRENSKRILAKAITFRIVTTLITVFIVFIITGSTHMAVGIGIIDAILRFTIYFIHESVWNDVRWGISFAPELGKDYKKIMNYRGHFNDDGKPKNVFYASVEGAHKLEKQIAGIFGGKKN